MERLGGSRPRSYHPQAGLANAFRTAAERPIRASTNKRSPIGGRPAEGAARESTACSRSTPRLSLADAQQQYQEVIERFPV
jgi:hypothetical protein